MGVSVTFTAPDARLRELGQALLEAERAIGNPEALLKRWGIQTVKWIQQNMRDGGSPGWKPLSPWTIAGRRIGPKKPGESKNPDAKPLIDTGHLLHSWDFITEHHGVRIYSKDVKAIYHHYGVAARDIVAKPGKTLAIPALDIQSGGPKSQFTLRGLSRALPNPRGQPGKSFIYKKPTGQRTPQRFAGRVGKPVVPYANIIFRQRVHWGGIPARPLLPTDEQILPTLKRVAQRYLTIELLNKLSHSPQPAGSEGTE